MQKLCKQWSACLEPWIQVNGRQFSTSPYQSGSPRLCGMVAPLMLARGCVSLFDFGPTVGPAWLLQAQYRNWGGWLSGHYDDKAMIWLELDRGLTADRVIPAGEVRRIAKANPTEQVIPGVEAGHCGPVPLTSLRGALLFYAREKFEHHRTVDAKLFARAEELGNLHWRPNPYIERLRNRRRPED